FARALKEDGMLGLARLQRKFRLLDSPYRTPQTLVGGPRLDGALMASSGRTAATKAMGKGSTQFQHLLQTEVPVRLLEQWLEMWRKHWEQPTRLRVELRPHTAGSELLELRVIDESSGEKLANIIFSNLQDRYGRNFLSVRDQNTVAPLRKKRMMSLVQLFLIHRYKADTVHYVAPSEDNESHVLRMKGLGIFSQVDTEVGQIIVAHVNKQRVAELLKSDGSALTQMIRKVSQQAAAKS
ncbi:MAG TPA: isocitrate lyase, partial [Candidatus Acidoferrum sp.]|nr:isocitrate lyase [Candidatus Acidoferrum sp.]